MIWEQEGGSLEVKTRGELPDGRPTLDEIVADGAAVHLEQMSHDHWWMGLEAGGKYFHLNFGLKVTARTSAFSFKGKDVKVAQNAPSTARYGAG
jgi:hypothetical protein